MGLPDFDELATPTLMRAARGTYANSIRAQLLAIGVDDLPRNGAFLLAGIDSTDGPRQDLASELGVTKQAVSLLIDVLTERGYLERSPDPEDRRRIALNLTRRGQEVIEAVSRAVEAVDAQLADRVPPEYIKATRATLGALAEIKTTAVATGAGAPRPVRQLRRFSPIFPVRDLAAALAHYSSLGFSTIAHEDGDEYGFANRDGISLHLIAEHDHGHDHHGAAAYLNVHDADALYEQWSRSGIAGETRPVHPTPYKMREGSHVDPDGNLIRFGSPMED
ncbi:MAG: MarR family transcriptional regulator [Acidimicrobiales bacterium]